MTLHGTGRSRGGTGRSTSRSASRRTPHRERPVSRSSRSTPTCSECSDRSAPGDPDFDLLRITAGTDYGLPSPGHTTLRQVPGGDWAVDSFFDVTYRIDFVGRAGGPVAGMSGSTTGTIRMQVGQGVGCTHVADRVRRRRHVHHQHLQSGHGLRVPGRYEAFAPTTTRARAKSAAADSAAVRRSRGPARPRPTTSTPSLPQVPKPIPTTGPPNVVTSTLTVSGVGPYLYDLNARTFITHTSSGQLADHAPVAGRHDRVAHDAQRRRQRQRLQRYALGRRRGSGKSGSVRVTSGGLDDGHGHGLRQPRRGSDAGPRRAARGVHRREPERRLDAHHRGRHDRRWRQPRELVLRRRDVGGAAHRDDRVLSQHGRSQDHPRDGTAECRRVGGLGLRSGHANRPCAAVGVPLALVQLGSRLHVEVAQRDHRHDRHGQRRDRRQRLQRNALGRQGRSGQRGSVHGPVGGVAHDDRHGLRHQHRGGEPDPRGGLRCLHRREPERDVDADDLR